MTSNYQVNKNREDIKYLERVNKPVARKLVKDMQKAMDGLADWKKHQDCYTLAQIQHLLFTAYGLEPEASDTWSKYIKIMEGYDG